MHIDLGRASCFVASFVIAAGEVPVVNIHIQTLSEPMEPFVKGVADLTTAAERSMGQM